MTPEIKERIAQIRRGEVPEGYKKDKKKVYPIFWKGWHLSDFCKISQGHTFKREYQGVTDAEWNYFKVADIGINPGHPYLESAINKVSSDTIAQIGAQLFSAGSIAFPRVGAALLNNNKKILKYDSVVDDNVLVLTILDTSVCDEKFLYFLLCTRCLADWCNSGLVPVINSRTVLKDTVYLPTIAEQQRIAAILTTQDKLIELKEKLLEEKKQQKKYLMQQLLTGKKRLPGFSGEWKMVRANQIFQNISNKNHGGKLEVLSATQERGVVPRNEVDIDIKYDKSSLNSYKKVEIGNFVISLRSFQGGIEYSNYEGIVSPAYTVLSPKVEISDGYYKHFFKSADYINRLNVAVYGIRDGKQISYSDFGHIPIPYPPIEEQIAIADILSTANHEIALLQQSIDAEKQKKKALMQLLLTGIVRVKI